MLHALGPERLIHHYGSVGVVVIVFAETGLFAFFLPGEIMLVVAGGYCASRHGHASLLDPGIVFPGAPLAAVAGGQVGYLLGHVFRDRLLGARDGRWLTPERLQGTETYLQRYGIGKALCIARFFPLVRTFISPVCGAIGTPLRRFAVFNAISGIVWALGFLLVGYIAGRTVDVDKIVLPTILIIALGLTLRMRHETRAQQ